MPIILDGSDAIGDLGDALAAKAPSASPTFTGAVAIPDVRLSAWISYTPTITAASGSFTTVSATGKYCQIGKACIVAVKIDITTNGTAAVGVRFTMPDDAPVGTLTYSGTGRENNVTGSMCQIVTGIGSTFATVFTYANAYPGGDGHSLLCTLTYELA